MEQIERIYTKLNKNQKQNRNYFITIIILMIIIIIIQVATIVYNHGIERPETNLPPCMTIEELEVP